ncbi:MAG: MJ0042-type zinc finger domain-containing protein, partial [Pseudohongiellaceae bacterium]
MSHLLTQCPFCQTSFKVSDEQMQAANGVVRCGFCMEVFLARVGQAFQEEITGKTDIKQDQSSGSQPVQETFDESSFLSPDFV